MFCLALLLVVSWSIGGFIYGFSDTYQLVINTGTTIVTFLMVFIIQNEQVRSDYAVQLKLDELIHAVKKADNKIQSIEDLPIEALEAMVAKHHSRKA